MAGYRVADVMRGVVQIVALRRAGFGNQYAPAWTGSGTIVDPAGLILTNCHVANPRAMGMAAPDADALAVAMTDRSDDAPALTYVAQVVAQSPELDLAVLRIVAGLDGRPVANLKLTAIALGDSDVLELGDSLRIFGYPGIGGETVTLTSGTVSGFTHEKGVKERRAWIKTDATIAGGNSGGTAINERGELIGVPTQAAAGSDVKPVDARPVIDTNQDGRVDERDTPMAVGGFINGLRPINLAKPLLKKAGAHMGATQATTAPQPAQPVAAPPSGYGPSMGPPSAGVSSPTISGLVFSSGLSRDGRPVNAATLLPTGAAQIFASFDYWGMRDGLPWNVVWAWNTQPVVQEEGKWDGGESGHKTVSLAKKEGLPDGNYNLVIAVQKEVVTQGQVTVGKRVDDTDTEISGQVVDSQTGRGIAGALVIALKPGVKVKEFIQRQQRDMTFTSVQTDRNGAFTLPQQLPKGQAYSLVVVARGYRDMAIESALRIPANAPERAQVNPISLQPE
jgi:serine protease Do